jgi:hypothetical protein
MDAKISNGKGYINIQIPLEGKMLKNMIKDLKISL